jgi:periplasmic divalent cation tolerance protein
MSLPGSAQYLVALTTTPSEPVASSLVRALVERRLIACGTMLVGASSIYRWKGSIEAAPEVVVLMKTTVDRWDALKAALPSLHPYDVPELLALPVADGLQPYLDWLFAETRDEH